MKKVFVLMLCLLMLAGSALAGTMPVEVQELTEKLTLVYLKPDGVKEMEVADVYDMKVVTFELEDESMPNYLMVISYSDELNGMDMTDLTEEQVAHVVALTAADSEEHSYQMINMADEWPAVLVDYEGESDWVDAFTIISGYLIQIHGAHDDFAPLTDAESEFAFTLLDCIDIVEMDD